jgi:hypothetical protein
MHALSLAVRSGGHAQGALSRGCFLDVDSINPVGLWTVDEKDIGIAEI